MKVKKGDTVKVIAGKDKNKVGEVLRVLPAKNRVVVKGVNIVTKHAKARMGQPGEIVKYEGSIDASNVLVKCPGSDTFTRVGYSKNDKGKKVRIAKKNGEALDQAFVKNSN